MGLDLRDDLDPLAASSTRDDVDVFEIDKSYLTNNKIYILFDIYDKAIKVEEGLSTLPNLDETIKENQQEIKKEQEEMGIQDTPEDSQVHSKNKAINVCLLLFVLKEKYYV